MAVLAGCDLKPGREACSLTIAPQAVTVSVNSATPIVGTAFDCKGASIASKKINYSSANTLVATVTGDGQVIGVAVGQTTVSATADGKSASAQVTVVPEAATTVTVSPSTFVLRQGNIKEYTAVAKNSRGDVITGRTFTWSSSNSAIASVDNSGRVTAHQVGNVTIAATTDNVIGTAAVQVTLVPIGSCSLAPASQKITVNGQFQPTLTLRDTANAPIPLTGRTMTWTSDNEVNATVSQSGVVTARKAGTARITATSPENTSISCSMNIEGVDPRIVSVVIQQRNQTLRLSIPRQFTVQLLDSLNQVIPPGRVVTWTSLTPTIANVTSSGLVTGISLGTGRVMVDAEGARDTVSFTVTKIPVATITLSPQQSTVFQGSTVQLNPTVTDSLGATVTDRTIEWTSSDPLRATVSGTGLVSTFGTGTVTITASTEGRSANSQVIIQQIPADTIVITGDTIKKFTTTAANKSFSYVVQSANGTQLLGRTVSISSSNPSVARVQGNASTVTNGTVVLETASQVGVTTFTMQALNALGQPEGKVTRVTVEITAPPTP